MNYCAPVGNLILVVWLNYVELFMLSCDYSVLVPDMLLISVLSISVGFKVPNIVALGTLILLYAVLSMGVLSDFGF